MPAPAPPPPKRTLPPATKQLPKAPPAPVAAPRAVKSFSINPWTGENEGEKIILYGPSGMGKTTLATMLPKPVFIGFDDGARKIRHPVTGEPVDAITDCRSFADLRDVTSQPTIFKDHKTLVIDTITKTEEFGEQYTFDSVKVDGKTPKSVEAYGYGKGYRYLQETMRLLLQDLENLVRHGVNVVLLAQENAVAIPNAEGLDYLQAGPKLCHTKQYSVRLDYQEWADHVFRIGYAETSVSGAKDAKVGKVTSSDTNRVIFTHAARHFFAKTRKADLPNPVSFDAPSDDSIWQFLFPETQA